MWTGPNVTTTRITMEFSDGTTQTLAGERAERWRDILDRLLDNAQMGCRDSDWQKINEEWEETAAPEGFVPAELAARASAELADLREHPPKLSRVVQEGDHVWLERPETTEQRVNDKPHGWNDRRGGGWEPR